MCFHDKTNECQFNRSRFSSLKSEKIFFRFHLIYNWTLLLWKTTENWLWLQICPQGHHSCNFLICSSKKRIVLPSCLLEIMVFSFLGCVDHIFSLVKKKKVEIKFKSLNIFTIWAGTHNLWLHWKWPFNTDRGQRHNGPRLLTRVISLIANLVTWTRCKFGVTDIQSADPKIKRGMVDLSTGSAAIADNSSQAVTPPLLYC